jgi:sulfide:quinone oxidoreductase
MNISSSTSVAGKRVREQDWKNQEEDAISDIVVLGAGLSGTIIGLRAHPAAAEGDRLTVTGQGPRYHFVPSNPWIAIGWREQHDIEVVSRK